MPFWLKLVIVVSNKNRKPPTLPAMPPAAAVTKDDTKDRAQTEIDNAFTLAAPPTACPTVYKTVTDLLEDDLRKIFVHFRVHWLAQFHVAQMGYTASRDVAMRWDKESDITLQFPDPLESLLDKMGLMRNPQDLQSSSFPMQLSNVFRTRSVNTLSYQPPPSRTSKRCWEGVIEVNSGQLTKP